MSSKTKIYILLFWLVCLVYSEILQMKMHSIEGGQIPRYLHLSDECGTAIEENITHNIIICFDSQNGVSAKVVLSIESLYHTSLEYNAQRRLPPRLLRLLLLNHIERCLINIDEHRILCQVRYARKNHDVNA